MFDPLNDCCSGPDLRHYADCLEDMYRETDVLPARKTPLAQTVGLTLAEDIKAPLPLPSFDNSAMDGFAFAASSVRHASSDNPVTLHVLGSSIAGDQTDGLCVLPGQAAKVMTGAPMPKGTDTVLPVEAASWDDDALVFEAPYPFGRHVRRVGQDVTANETVLKAGTTIKSQHFPILSALGIGSVPVRPFPTAAWISTGQEISDDFNRPLASGQIYNATRVFSETAAQRLGFNVQHAVTVKDTAADFSAALETALAKNPTLILSTGGVSAGQYDFVRPALEETGAEIIFHKARIKPAKPVLFAKLTNGTYFFGLPGNPISTALALRAFVHPFVRGLAGRRPEAFKVARLTRDISVTGGKTVFLMARVHASDDGIMLAIPHKRQQSFQTMPFAECNAWLMVPEGVTELEAGDQVQWFPFSPSAM